MHAKTRRKGQRPRRLLALALGLGLTLAGAAPGGAAEVPVRRWGLGLEGGVMKLQEGAWDYAAADQFGRLRLSRGLSRHWAVSAAWLVGHTRPGVDRRGAESGWSFHSEPPYRTLISQPMLELEHRLTPGAVVSPVLVGGVGLTSWRVIETASDGVGWFPEGETINGYDLDGNPVELSGTSPTLSFGLGIDVTLNGSLHLGLGARYQLLQGTDRDNVGLSERWGPEHVDANTALTGAWAALTWWPGSSDSDGDGVPDDRDRCPDQPEDRDGVNDLDGCPDLDNDGDGIPDDRDLCPNLAEDRDGFADDDGCPDLDNDGDGIPDARDRCPDQPEDVDGDADNDGCPDLEIERAPEPAKSVTPTPEAAAAPREEAAPQTAATPPTPADFILEGVAFASGSAVLAPDARAQLEEAAAWLAGEPGRVEIRGHTDAAGDEAANRELSRRRAEAVRDAFVQMGLPRARLTVVGAGESEPIADNATPAGRAANRRVEIRVLR